MMGASTGIAWTDATVNFWWGCTKVSAACDFCYAETWARRLGKDLWGAGKSRWQIAGAVKLAFKLERQAVREGRRIKVFSNSMSDFFDSEVPDAWRDQAMAVIALTPHLDWLVLTKRPKVMREYLSGDFQPILDKGSLARPSYRTDPPGARTRIAWALQKMVPPADWRYGNVPWPLSNLWLGVTAEDQKMADLRIPELLATPAARRLVSMEPLLGPVHLRHLCRGRIDALAGTELRRMGQHNAAGQWDEGDYSFPIPRLDWIIVGGESGSKARPFDVNAARSLRDQCRSAGTAFFMKQLGARPWFDRDEPTLYLRDRAGADPAEWPEDLRVQQFPEAA